MQRSRPWTNQPATQPSITTGSQPTVFPDPNAEYCFMSALDQNKCIDITVNADPSQCKPILYDAWGSKNQKFRFKSLGNGKYNIISLLGYSL